MKVLVTGADGFVGTHLTAALRIRGHDVIGVDKPQGDLAAPWVGAEMIGRLRPDYVVHLAARYGRLLCRDEPHRAVADNAASTTEIAAACARLDIPVLYTSTSEVYGDHGEDVITEESELRMPTTIYGLSKRWGEEALRLYLPPGQLCVVRANMLYGPGQRSGYGHCALATFIENALAGEPLTAHADASRSWLYISDAIRALRMLIEQRQFGTFNLGNSTERTSMRSLANFVVDVSCSRSRIRVVDAPTIQIRHKNYDASKLQEAVGWRPEVSLGAGLRATVATRIVEDAA